MTGANSPTKISWGDMGLEKLQAELFVLALNILADCMIFIAQD